MKKIMMMALVMHPYYMVASNVSDTLFKGAPSSSAPIDEYSAAQIRKLVFLNEEERKHMFNYLKYRIDHARTHDERLKYELLFHSYYQGLYDQVVQEINRLGENIQSILKVTGLRKDLLLGKMDRFVWYIKEIAALPSSQFKSERDKVVYIESLAEQLLKHQHTVSQEVFNNALEQLISELTSCKVAGIFAKKVTVLLQKLQSLKPH